jgi:hypothetical protein
MKSPTPTTVAELRAAIEAAKKIALQRLDDHADDDGQFAASRRSASRSTGLWRARNSKGTSLRSR